MTTVTEDVEVPTTTGDGEWRIKISLASDVAFGDHHNDENEVVCVMKKGTYDLRTDGRVPLMRFMTTMSGITDFEHDPSKFALVEVAIPHVLYDAYGRRVVMGVIADARLYPAGVDPLTQTDGDGSTGWCEPEDSGYKNHKRHRFAPYLPPETRESHALKGRCVIVEFGLEKHMR